MTKIAARVTRPGGCFCVLRLPMVSLNPKEVRQSPGQCREAGYRLSDGILAEIFRKYSLGLSAQIFP